MGAHASDNDDMVEVKDALISHSLTILHRSRRKSLQLHWDKRIFGTNTKCIGGC